MAQPLEQPEQQGTLPRLPAARLEQWARLLTAQRAGLRLYQWLWLLLCVVAALAVAAPRVLSQPVVYQASAEVHFDAQRYAGLYDAAGNPTPDFGTALCDMVNAVQGRIVSSCVLPFGPPDQRIDVALHEPGLVEVQGSGASAAAAQQLANAAAAELTRQVRAAGGREVLRNLIGWELVAALDGEAADMPFQQYLRDIYATSAFPMSRPIEPVAERMRVEDLPREEQQDLARALEARYDMWTFAINAHTAALDQACGTAALARSTAREQALQFCAANDPAVAHVLDQRNRALTSRAAISTALTYMREQHEAVFRPDQQAAVYRVPATLPDEPQPRYTGPLLALVVLAGVAFGGLGVAVDRAAGVMPKLRELWSYRELIGNMVLRDLRARYKGSTLGYVWTQLAPLLMMLVFMFVFTVLLPSNIALFPVFLIVALLPWNYCAESVMNGTRSVLDNAHLIKKVFFPREVLPLASVLSSLVNYVLSLPVMFLVMAVTQLVILGRLNFSLTFAYLPVIVILQTLFLVGMAFFLSALAVFLRDTVHLIGIVVQFWFFLTPVFYSLDIIGEPLARVIRWVNPMASLVDFYRDVLYGSRVVVGEVPTPGLPALDSVLRMVVTVLIVLAAGYWFFRRQSARFGEEL
jgi:lipopolysaccharide transport system permease protein